MRSDFDVLELDAKLIDSSKVIEGYIYLSKEIAEEKKQARREKRMKVLFAFLCVSVAVLVWDKQLFAGPQYQNLEEYHPAPALGDVLSDGVVEHLNPETASSAIDAGLEVAVDIPEDIVKFIDADITSAAHVSLSNAVVLEEVDDRTDNTINIDKIIASGNQLFKRDRLMSPPEHNAFIRYETVLSLQPDHPEALEGIKKIVDRYVYLAESVIAKGETYKVPGLIKKAYQAGEKYMDVSVIIQQFSGYLSNDSVFSEIASEDESIESTAQSAVAEITTQTELQSDSDFNNNAGFHGDVIFNADRKIAATAYQLYIQGDISSAEKVLTNFTRLSGFWGSSNDLLLKMYLSQSKIGEAENLIYENKALTTYQFAEKAARVMMARGDSQGALDMLAAYRPEFLDNKGYYVLMASLYNKVGDYKRSVYWYRQLLSVNHKDARLWLGLAVSLDALNNVNDAMKAFEYARLYAQNQSVVKNYINERQLALAD